MNLINLIFSHIEISVITILIFLGIISVFREKYYYKKIISNIIDYHKHLITLLSKLDSAKGIEEDIKYFIEQQDIGVHLHGYCSYPTSSIANKLIKGYYTHIQDDATEITKLAIEKNKELEDKNKALNKLFLNPFTLFYRGVGLSLKFVFGYIIELFNNDFDFNGKPWKYTVSTISVISMLMTIASFFGFDFN